jgi:hypothetical protein
MNARCPKLCTVRALCVVLGLLLSVASAPAGATPPGTLVVCYPGGPVNANDANPAMESMLRVVEKAGKWPPGTFTSKFTAKIDECRKLMADKKPGFAIVSLGLYLELRDSHHLLPLVQPRLQGRSVEVYRVLVGKGKFRTLQDLKGKKLGGTPLEEPEFLRRIVFRGEVNPKTHFVLKPSSQALKSLRGLTKGELDAVVVTDQQYRSLGSLPLARDLEAIYTSQEIPLLGLVADEKVTSADDRARLRDALRGMCAADEGKKLCSLFGVEGFAPVDKGSYDGVTKLWTGQGGK